MSKFVDTLYADFGSPFTGLSPKPTVEIDYADSTPTYGPINTNVVESYQPGKYELPWNATFTDAQLPAKVKWNTGQTDLSGNAVTIEYMVSNEQNASQQANVQAAMTAQNYTSARGLYLDNLNNIVTNIWAAATRTLTAFSFQVALTSSEHTTIQTTDVPQGMINNHYTQARGDLLDNLSNIVSNIWGYVNRTLTSFGFNVTVGTNNDKTGYALSSAEHTAIQTTDVPQGMINNGYTSVRGGYLDGLPIVGNTVWGYASRTLTAFGFGVTVSTNNDKTGYKLDPTDTTATSVASKLDVAVSSRFPTSSWIAPPTDYQQRNVAVTLPTTPPTGYGGGSSDIPTDGTFAVTIHAVDSPGSAAVQGVVQNGLGAQGYTSTRAGYLDTLNGIVANVASAVAADISTDITDAVNAALAPVDPTSLSDAWSTPAKAFGAILNAIGVGGEIKIDGTPSSGTIYFYNKSGVLITQANYNNGSGEFKKDLNV